ARHRLRSARAVQRERGPRVDRLAARALRDRLGRHARRVRLPDPLARPTGRPRRDLLTATHAAQHGVPRGRARGWCRYPPDNDTNPVLGAGAGRGAGAGQAGVASAAARAAAGNASRTRATAASSCAAETNHASNTDGGRLTPASSIAWKNAR